MRWTQSAIFDAYAKKTGKTCLSVIVHSSRNCPQLCQEFDPQNKLQIAFFPRGDANRYLNELVSPKDFSSESSLQVEKTWLAAEPTEDITRNGLIPPPKGTDKIGRYEKVERREIGKRGWVPNNFGRREKIEVESSKKFRQTTQMNYSLSSRFRIRTRFIHKV